MVHLDQGQKLTLLLYTEELPLEQRLKLGYHHGSWSAPEPFKGGADDRSRENEIPLPSVLG